MSNLFHSYSFPSCVPVISPVRECNDTDVRLVSGQTSHDGQVEICRHGEWGQVCDEAWDTKDAKVVCRQLGYDGCELSCGSITFMTFSIFKPPVSTTKIHHFSSSGLSFYYLDEVDCRGNESMLSDCEHKELSGHGCDLGTVAAVLCSCKFIWLLVQPCFVSFILMLFL